nr:recombinase family protein [uncultured Oscillibacter sp.]
MQQGGYKPNEIVKALFERNIPTPAKYKAAHGYNGRDISRCCGIWSTSAVVHILDDERCTGAYIMGKREVTEVGGHRVRMKDESQWIKIADHHPAIRSCLKKGKTPSWGIFFRQDCVDWT